MSAPALRLLLVALALAWPARARALFGAGDLVYDPANVAETINVLHTTQAQLDSLGSLLGVSTRQLDELLGLADSVGRKGGSAGFGRALSPQELQNLVRSVPGLADADLGALFNTDSQLDAFLGVPAARWIEAIEHPGTFYRDILVNPAISRVGASTGLDSPAVAYAQWYASRSAEDRANLGGRAAAEISDLLASDWLKASRQRRVNLQALAAENTAAQAESGGARSLADQQHAQARIGANSNHILIEAAAQAADAQETAARAAGAQSRILRDSDEARRNAAELQLDLPW